MDITLGNQNEVNKRFNFVRESLPVARWLPNHAYTQASPKVTNSGNVYQCITAGTSASSGGPTTTSANITDGTAHWAFVQTGTSVLGDISFDDTEAHAVVTSALEHRNGYWADPTHGGSLHSLRSLTSRTPSQAEAFVKDSLDALVQAGDISINNVVANANISSSGVATLQVDLTWATPDGTIQEVQTLEV